MTPGSSMHRLCANQGHRHLRILVNTSFTEVPASYHSSPSFTVANILGAPTLDLHEGTTYNVVHLPLYLPIPFVINDTTKGTITEASMDILNTTIKNDTFRACCILEHDATCSDEPIRCTTNGLGKIMNCFILPRLLAGQSWGSLLSCKVAVVGNNDKVEAKPSINVLVSHLTKITNLSTHSTAVHASVPINPGDIDNLDLDSLNALAAHIFCKSPSGCPSQQSHS